MNALKSKKQLLLKQKEINEIRQLERDIADLEGVGTKRRMAKEVGMRLGKQASSVGWKGLKLAGGFVRNVIEAEAREQARDRERDRMRSRPRVKTKVKTRRKVKPKTKRKKKRR